MDLDFMTGSPAELAGIRKQETAAQENRRDRDMQARPSACWRAAPLLRCSTLEDDVL
jgi:hypothetical protein